MSEITEDDLTDALKEEMRLYYAVEKEKERKPGEWTLDDYMRVNDLVPAQRSNANRTVKAGVNAGAITERRGVVNGRSCTLYHFVAQESGS